MDDATLKMWEASLSPGMTSEDSIRSGGWNDVADSLPVPRARSLGESDQKPGDSVDFEIREKLGAGGMGVVYTAHQTSINREVALKMVRPEHADSQSASEALMSEAVVTGCLDHPNVVPVYDLGVDDEGRLFYAMKEVEGFPWSTLIGEKTLDENLEILLRVSDTIAFAHSKGILHRDLKPQNIMLGAFGEIMVMDWGAACTLSGSNVAGLLPTDTAYCGTPAYMAPEMAKADKNRIGEQSDVYLLGTILYHILTGRPPRCEKDPLICLAAAARNQIDPMKLDGELQRIALKAMADAPADRFQSVEEFQQAVRGYRAHAESLAHLESAKACLAKAKVESDYELFNQTVYGLREALAMWPENKDAERLLSTATTDYARCAFDQHDYELALSLLDDESDLVQEIKKAINEQDARKTRIRRLLITARIMLATITILSIAGFFVIRTAQRETEKQRVRASGEHRKSLINLISAHYGNQNYEAAVSSFWNLYDEYGMDGLSEQTRAEARIAAAMNPYRGWAADTNGIPQQVGIGDYVVKRPAAVTVQQPLKLRRSGSSVPDDFEKWKPLVFGTSPDGRRYSLVTEEGLLVSGSVEPGGFYLEQKIELRNYTACTILKNGYTALWDKSGTVHLYDMNTFALRELVMPGRTAGVCAGEMPGSFYGLIAVTGKLRVYDVPVSMKWDTPYRMLAFADQSSPMRWESYAHAVEEGRDAEIRTSKQHDKYTLSLKSDLQPIFDPRFFPAELKAASLGIDGAQLAMVWDDKLHIMNLSEQLPIHSMQPTPVHYISKAGTGEWPFHSLETAATNLQQVMHAASDGDTILVEPGEYEVEEEIVITQKNDLSLKSLEGRGECTLIGKGSGRIMHFKNCDGLININGFTFQGAGTGGGIDLQGCINATVSNCHFIDNLANKSGGGLYISTRRSEESTIHITDCTFSNNSAQQEGGGLNINQLAKNSFLTVSNCVFSGNVSQGSGGGMRVLGQGDVGYINVVNSKFSGNRTELFTGSGGGMALLTHALDGHLKVSQSEFSNNTSLRASGGGLHIVHRGLSGTVNVDRCRIMGNSCEIAGGGLLCDAKYSQSVIRECHFSDNDSHISGGGLTCRTEDGRVLVERCIVERNQAESYGGAISGERIYPLFNANLVVSGCFMANNYCVYQGGAVRDRVIVDSKIVGNHAGLGGGVSFSTLTNCIVYGNVAKKNPNFFRSVNIAPASPAFELLFDYNLTNNPVAIGTTSSGHVLLPISPLSGGGDYDPKANFKSDGNPADMDEHLQSWDR